LVGAEGGRSHLSLIGVKDKEERVLAFAGRLGCAAIPVTVIVGRLVVAVAAVIFEAVGASRAPAFFFGGALS
jgi:hypothetical protein